MCHFSDWHKHGGLASWLAKWLCALRGDSPQSLPALHFELMELTFEEGDELGICRFAQCLAKARLIHRGLYYTHYLCIGAADVVEASTCPHFGFPEIPGRSSGGPQSVISH